MPKLAIVLLFSVLIASCGGGAASSAGPTLGDETTARTGPPEGWPRVLRALPGEGPALFLGPESDSPALGYVSGGTRVRIDGGPVNGRVPVTVAGGMTVRAWMPLSRLALYATRRGRIPETPTYLAVGDPVSIVSREPDRSWRVQIGPWLGRGESDRLGPRPATLSADWLSETPPEGRDTGLNPGENRLVPGGREIPVYDRARGQVIATLPAIDPPHTVVVLRARSGWSGVRVGVGPYLVGYVQGELGEAAEAPPAPVWTPDHAAEGEAPISIQNEEGPLRRIRAGARVRFVDRVIARLRTDAWARELGTAPGGRLDVYIAADDGCAIRGAVRPRDVLEADGGDGAEAAGGGAPSGDGDDDAGGDR